MSSLGTSSPVSASTLVYLIRWPGLRLSWWNEIFSLSEVAGYSATGQVTRDRRRKPFQLARGAMLRRTPVLRAAPTQDERDGLVPTPGPGRASFFGFRLSADSTFVLVMF